MLVYLLMKTSGINTWDSDVLKKMTIEVFVANVVMADVLKIDLNPT